MDELSVLDGGKCILQLRGVRPFLSDKYDITKHPNYKYLSDYDPRNNFDIEKFLSTRLKTKANDTYDTYEITETSEWADFFMKKWGEVKQDLSITDHLFEQNRKFIIAISKKNFETAIAEKGVNMDFFNSAIDTLQTLVVALGGALCVWGGINLLEGCGNDNWNS